MGRRGAVAAAAVGAAVVGMSGPAAWASSGGHPRGTAGGGSSSAADAPAGNNGHIQIDEFQMDGGNGNDPHVGCGFSISFFGYDAGTRTASVTVTPWAPTRGGTPFHDGGLTWKVSQRTGGNQLDFNYPVSPGTVAGMFSGVAPAHQGYHARVEVEVNGSQGSDDKYKMVWIAPCASAGSAAATGAGGSSTAGGAPAGVAGESSTRPAGSSVEGIAAAPVAATSSSATGPGQAAGRVGAAGASTPVAVLGESVSRPLAAAPAGASAPTPGGLPFTGADIALESLVSLGLVGTGAFLTRRYRLRRR